MTVSIRALGPADAAPAAAVLTEAFADDGRVAALARDLRVRRDGGAALVAVDGSPVIGVVQLSVGWVDAHELLLGVLVLSPLAVAPTHRSQGVGAALLDAARHKAASLGSPLLFLEGDPDYYSARGWRAAGPLGFAPPSTRIPAPAFQVVTLAGYDPATMRGALVYNDTFWTHDCVGLRGRRLERWDPPSSPQDQ